MRQLKFRAWHLKTGMHDAQKMTDNGLTMMFDGRILYGNFVAESGWQIMQYTGLKDKKGVDIYEGDIVAHDVLASWEQHSRPYKNQRGTVEIQPSVTLFGCWDSAYCCNITILGNIYENPDLLK